MVLAIFIVVVTGLAYYVVQHNLYICTMTFYELSNEVEVRLTRMELALMQATNANQHDLNRISYKLACSYIKNRQYTLALPLIERLLEAGGNGPYPITYDELIDRAHRACSSIQIEIDRAAHRTYQGNEREFETFLLRMYNQKEILGYGHKKIFPSLLEFYETHERMSDAEQLCQQEIARGAVGRGKFCLAQVYANEGRVQEAEAIYKELLNRFPGNANTGTVLKDYRKLLLGMGKRSEANKITERLKQPHIYPTCGIGIW